MSNVQIQGMGFEIVKQCLEVESDNSRVLIGMAGESGQREGGQLSI